MRTETDVLVVGAGPTGLALAVGLRRLGADCRIIDREPPVTQARAMGLSARSLEVMRALGVADRVLAEAVAWRTMDIHAHRRTAFRMPSDVSDRDAPHPFGAVLPQDRVVALLDDRLGELGGSVSRPLRLTALDQDADGVAATLAGPPGGETVRAKYLVGCDGAHSAVRHLLGLPFDGSDYEDRLVAADVFLDWDLPQDSAHVFLGGDGTLAAFPFPEPGKWRLAAFGGNAAADEGPEATTARLRALLAENGPPGASIREAVHTSYYAIHRRLVHRFRAGRCLVAGDAAHIHSPAGGQGMNTGMQDGFNLAWKLAYTLRGWCGDRLLDSYHDERHPVAEAVLAETDRLTRLILPRGPVTGAVRDAVLRVVGGVAAAGHGAAHALSQLDVEYRHSPIVAEDRGAGGGGEHRAAFDRGPHPGDRAPDAALSDPAADAPRRLFDLLYRDGRHTLLAFDGLEPSGGDPSAAIGAAGRLGERVAAVRVLRPGEEYRQGPAGPALADPDGVLHRRYGAIGACLYLIRPDGHVGYRAQPPDPARLEAYLARAYGWGPD